MEYAVIETGGKQYKAVLNDILEVERMPFGKNNKITFDKVLLYVADEKVTIGKPYIAKFTVEAEVIDNIKGEKIRVARFRAKSRHRRTYGHRQSLTKIKIIKIGESTDKLQIEEKKPAIKKVAKTRAKK